MLPSEPLTGGGLGDEGRSRNLVLWGDLWGPTGSVQTWPTSPLDKPGTSLSEGNVVHKELSLTPSHSMLVLVAPIGAPPHAVATALPGPPSSLAATQHFEVNRHNGQHKP